MLKHHAPAPALAAYRRHVSPRITAHREHVRFVEWARTGRRLRDEFGTPGVSFEADGIWITDTDGRQWCYEPDSWLSALGKELGWVHEKAELDSVIAGLPAGGTYVDVGAHVGGFAIPVADAHSDVDIQLFEPVPATRALLEKNLARNGVADRVRIWTCAVGSRSSHSRMSGVDGVANHLVEGGKAAGPGSVEVQVETLDELLLKQAKRVDVIKCDIEGGELPAMRGAEQILRRDHPALMLEVDRRYTPRFSYQPRELFDYLGNLGYTWQWFTDDGLQPEVDMDEALAQTNNFLFTAR